MSLLLLVARTASAQSVSVPIPDLHAHDRACLPGTGGIVPCVELYEYQVDLTDLEAELDLDQLQVQPGLRWWSVDATVDASVNDRASPFHAHVYTSIGGILGMSQTCDGWIDPFTVSAGVDAEVTVHPLRGTVDVNVPPLQSDFSDLDGSDIELTGQGLSCTVGLVDQALGAIPGLNLSLFDFVVDAVVPVLEDTIAGMNDEIEAWLNGVL